MWIIGPMVLHFLFDDDTKELPLVNYSISDPLPLKKCVLNLLCSSLQSSSNLTNCPWNILIP